MNQLQLVECPRDAMQGLHDFIPTETKIAYINRLLTCGFHTIDFGSFVSPKAIPQMRDTRKVLDGLDDSDSKLLAIVANEKGAEIASKFERVDYFGYPFSISEQFQLRNTKATIDQSFSRVERIKEIAEKSNTEIVLYISMAFGNPYGELWNEEIVLEWSQKLYDKLEIKIQALSDTIGAGDPELVTRLFELAIPNLPEVTFGAHLHTIPQNAQNLIEAAYNAGCRRFDGAIKGFGGCPMAKDDLTGNMPTERMLEWFNKNEIVTGINEKEFAQSMIHSETVFPK